MLTDRDDEAQVRLDHLLLRDQVAALDALGEADLLVGGEQRHLPDLAQVLAQRVEAGLDVQVELGCLLAADDVRRARLLRRAVEELDVVVEEVGVEVLELLLGDLGLLERAGDLVVCEVPLLLALLHQCLELFDIGQSDVDRQHWHPRHVERGSARAAGLVWPPQCQHRPAAFPAVSRV
jgi:hypothetical protein